MESLIARIASHTIEELEILSKVDDRRDGGFNLDGLKLCADYLECPRNKNKIELLKIIKQKKENAVVLAAKKKKNSLSHRLLINGDLLSGCTMSISSKAIKSSSSESLPFSEPKNALQLPKTAEGSPSNAPTSMSKFQSVRNGNSNYFTKNLKKFFRYVPALSGRQNFE